MRAADTARFAELIVPMSQRDREAGIAYDERSHPFGMWQSVVRTFNFDSFDEADMDSVDEADYPAGYDFELPGSFGAQTLFAIASACELVHNVWREELKDAVVAFDGSWQLPGDGVWAKSLPSSVLGFATPEWLARFLQGFENIRLRIFNGTYRRPLCVGEEMALHVAVAAAQTITRRMSWSHFDLPAIDDDVLIGFLDDVLDTHLNDDDAIELFDFPDAIVSPGPGPGGRSHVHPSMWFVPIAQWHPDVPVAEMSPVVI